jgi:hypothetical protein
MALNKPDLNEKNLFPIIKRMDADRLLNITEGIRTEMGSIPNSSIQ